MADKAKKPQKLKARLPRGLEDRDPAAINATRQMVDKIRAVYELYGFEPVETPEISRGRFLNARFAVNGIQKGSRSLGTVTAMFMGFTFAWRAAPEARATARR